MFLRAPTRSVVAASVLAIVGVVLGAASNVGAETATQHTTAFPCTIQKPCSVAPTHYIAVPPKNWNGRDKLRVAVWMHGYGRTARIPMRNKKLLEVFDRHNYLFVAPSGYSKGWSVPGTPQEGRDDIQFIVDVLDDVEKRFSITRDDAVALGFSLGGSFVWTLACQRPELFRHHIAFAGGFWLPHPKHCTEGRVNLVHVHGNADSVVPLKGRPIGSRWYQGDVPSGLKFWRASKSCADMGETFAAPQGLSCRVANSCGGDGGGAVTSCRHEGGHIVKPQWVDWALDKLKEGDG